MRREPGRGAVVLTLADGTELRAEELLVATGRAPVTGDLDLAKAGVELDGRGYIVVDEHCAPPQGTCGRLATWPAVQSSPTPRGTTSG